MSKCNIYCSQHSKTERDWEITPDGRVWPCCYYDNAWDKRLATEFGQFGETLFVINDDIFWGLLQQEPDFNNLEIHSFDEIINHPIFQKHIYFEGWQSDNPPAMCVEECKIEIDTLTGNETTRAEEGKAWSHSLDGTPLLKDK